MFGTEALAYQDTSAGRVPGCSLRRSEQFAADSGIRIAFIPDDLGLEVDATEEVAAGQRIIVSIRSCANNQRLLRRRDRHERTVQ